MSVCWSDSHRGFCLLTCKAPVGAKQPLSLSLSLPDMQFSHYSFVLMGSNWYGCMQVSLALSSSSSSVELAIMSRPHCPEWRSTHTYTCFYASRRPIRYDRKCPFLCIYNHQITFTPISSFSASFNGNHVQNHTKPWTCPLKFPSLNIKSWWRILLQ